MLQPFRLFAVESGKQVNAHPHSAVTTALDTREPRHKRDLLHSLYFVAKKPRLPGMSVTTLCLVSTH